MKGRNIVILLAIGILSFIVLKNGCAGNTPDSIAESGGEIVLTFGGRVVTYNALREVSETYRIVAFNKTKDAFLRQQGVFMDLWGIELARMPEDRPFTQADRAHEKILALIPADAGVRTEMEALLGRQGCWKKVTITGSRVALIENGSPVNLSGLQLVFVRDIKGNW